MSQQRRTVKHSLADGEHAPRRYHDAPAQPVSQPEGASIACQINGSGGCAGKRRGAVGNAAFVTTRGNRATSTLNPADPWPFAKVKPESEREFISSLPDAPF
jgi:hypothetical protein